MIIRRAQLDEGEELRRIAAAAKGHWGYDADVVRRWAADGDFSPRALDEREVHVAEMGGRPVGWSSLLVRGDVGWLDDLWVDPGSMGQGVGSRLFVRAMERGRELGVSALEWEAEPNAVGFYEKVGGRYVRDSEPSEWGRVLPVMRLELGDDELP